MIKKIIAIAYCTVIEFIRNKVFLLMIVFGIVMVGMFTLLPAISSEDKIKLILRITFTMVGLFSIALIIFFISISIHRDIDEKTILTVFSRPVGRSIYISGKSLGFIGIAFIMVFAFSGFSLAYIRLVHGNALKDTRIFKPAKYIKGRGPFITGNLIHLDGIAEETKLIGEGSSAVWIFSGIGNAPFKEDNVKVSLKIGGLNAASNSGAAFVGIDIMDKDDKPLQSTQYAYVGNMNPNTTIMVEKILIKQNKIIKVKAFPVGENYYIFPRKDDIAFILKDRYSFYNNYFRAFGFVFIMVSLISVIALSAAAVFGQKMAIVLSFFTYITGNTLTYLTSFGNLIGLKSIAEMQSFIPGHGHLHQAKTLSKLPEYLTQGLHIAILKKYIIYFSSIFPNFKRFDPTGYFLYGTYIDNLILLQITAYMAIYAAVFLTITGLCFWKRELVSR